MARILVVEDEMGIADAVLYALRADGMAAEHCLRGEPALVRLRDESFDVAILDVGLPDLDGFALCRRLRDCVARLPQARASARAWLPSDSSTMPPASASAMPAIGSP